MYFLFSKSNILRVETSHKTIFEYKKKKKSPRLNE